MTRVIIGRSFDGLEARLVDETDPVCADTGTWIKANESKTRSNLAYGAVIGGFLFLIGSAVLGIVDKSFDEVQSVWNVFGPIAGAVIGHYFGGGDEKREKRSK